jgi:hypothetical protein
MAINIAHRNAHGKVWVQDIYGCVFYIARDGQEVQL